MKIYLLILAILFFAVSSDASMTVWGIGYKVEVHEPENWVAIGDVQNNDALLLGLYQKGHTWESSPSTIYARLIMNRRSLKKVATDYIDTCKKSCPHLVVTKLKSHERRLDCAAGPRPYSRLIRLEQEDGMKVVWVLESHMLGDIEANRPVFDQVLQTTVLEKRLIPWNRVHYSITQ